MEDFWFCFVPLFVAMDAIGLLPIYLNLTAGMSRTEQRRTLRQSVLTALMAAVAFVFVFASVGTCDSASPARPTRSRKAAAGSTPGCER